MSKKFIKHDGSVECVRCHRIFSGQFPERNFGVHYARTHANLDPSLDGNILEGAETRSSSKFEFGVTPSREHLIKMLAAGYTTPDIAWTYETSNGRMGHHMNLFGLHCYSEETYVARRIKANMQDPEGILLSEDKLRKLYIDDKLSACAIASMVGRSHKYVMQALREFGINIRIDVSYISCPHKYLVDILKLYGVDIYPGQLNFRVSDARRYRADIAFPEIKLAIEVDGIRHFDKEGNRKATDLARDAYFASIGWRTIRYTVNEMYDDVDAVVEEIIAQIRIMTQEREGSLKAKDCDIVRYSEEIRRDEDKEPH
jgi:hypothetical protein